MYKSILIPIDLEHVEMFPRAVEVALQLIDTDGGKIHSLYVDQAKAHGIAFAQLPKEITAQAQQETKAVVHSIFKQHVPEALRGSCHIRRGVVYDEILEEEKRVNPEVILIAAGKPGVSSYLLGSNAEKVLRHAQGSVFVIRDNHTW